MAGREIAAKDRYRRIRQPAADRCTPVMDGLALVGKTCRSGDAPAPAAVPCERVPLIRWPRGGSLMAPVDRLKSAHHPPLGPFPHGQELFSQVAEPPLDGQAVNTYPILIP
jgi:hypothetical protein